MAAIEQKNTKLVNFLATICGILARKINNINFLRAQHDNALDLYVIFRPQMFHFNQNFAEN